MTHVHLADTTLRDGMSSVGHQFTAEDVAVLARGLDRGGVRTIEVAHGIGIGASSLQFGIAAERDPEYVRAAVEAVEHADIAVLYVPGISTLADLDAAHDAGARVVRVATHCTEADCAEQVIEHARAHGMRAMSFLMMSHKLEAEALAEQARKLEGYGSQVIYVVDSAGALVPTGVTARVAALRSAVDVPIGFHAHNNFGLAVGNTLAATAAGATYADGSLRGLGASAGNAATEALAAALERSGHRIDVDTLFLADLAEHAMAPRMHAPQVVDQTALILGWAGLYSTFFHPAKRASAKYRVHLPDLLIELGRRNVIGGQEDMIVQVAAEMAGLAEPA